MHLVALTLLGWAPHSSGIGVIVETGTILTLVGIASVLPVFHPDRSTRSIFSPMPLPDWFNTIIRFESTRPTVVLSSWLPSAW